MNTNEMSDGELFEQAATHPNKDDRNNNAKERRKVVKPDDIQYRSKAKLKARGWTEGLIRRFLGKPDKEKPNPRYASAKPMKLYKTQRVDKAESSSEFQEAQSSLKISREAAKKAVETKRQKVAVS